MTERLVIVVAKAPVPGKVKTRLTQEGVSPENAARWASAFLQDTLTVAQSPLLRADCWLAWEGHREAIPPTATHLPTLAQPSGSLGERLMYLVETAFQTGYKKVCLIGSDAPHLPVGFLQEAFGRFPKNSAPQIVLGPAEDGGYYLIGLNQCTTVIFTGIEWSSPNVLAQTREKAAANQISVALLPLWHDIDTVADLCRLQRDLKRQTVSAPVTATLWGTLHPTHR
jgi:hypothetical protein